MYNPTFKTTARQLPILSHNEMDTMGERLVADFYPAAMETPMEIDIDRFLTQYLGLTQDFKYLSHCGLYLGMTVFEESDRIIVFNPDEYKAEYITAKAGTVFIDCSLLDCNQEHRYRFTVAHECSHQILHFKYFEHLSSMLSADYIPSIQCRVDKTKAPNHTNYKRTEKDWMEWQANCLASSILMPRKMVLKAVRQAERKSPSVNAGLEAVIRTFNVSNEAAYFRLQELGIIQAQNKR